MGLPLYVFGVCDLTVEDPWSERLVHGSLRQVGRAEGKMFGRLQLLPPMGACKIFRRHLGTTVAFQGATEY